MRTKILLMGAAAPVALAAIWLGAGAPYAQQASSPADVAEAEAAEENDALGGEDLARGAYLVHHVAMCHECHSPRDAEGELVTAELLMGAAIPVAAPHFSPRWGLRAPAIAGLPGYSDDEAMRLLTRGITSRNTVARPPMPQYRLSDDDARAVIAYLRSLR